MKRIIRLTESDLTRIVRRVIMEQAEDKEISQALDELTTQLESMMMNVVRKHPILGDRANEAKEGLDSFINKAKNMQLSNKNTIELIKKQIIDLLSLGGQGGYNAENLRKVLNLLFTKLYGILNQNYNERHKSSILKLINGTTEDLQRMMMLK